MKLTPRSKTTQLALGDRLPNCQFLAADSRHAIPSKPAARSKSTRFTTNIRPPPKRASATPVAHRLHDLRCADILLMYAEAKNELNELDERFGTNIRRSARAGFTAESALGSPARSGKTAQRHPPERRVEFVEEGDNDQHAPLAQGGERQQRPDLRLTTMSSWSAVRTFARLLVASVPREKST